MAALPTFRNRRIPSRSDYTLLENTDSDVESVRRRSISSQITNQSSTSVLCDKCWSKHERNRASKRCLDCKQNLCTACARSEETTRPWWLPSWLVQCWRFIFTKAYIPHSIVDLKPTESESPHWANTQEASQIQRIPRVSRSSLRSNQSSVSRHTDKPIHSKQELGSSSFSKEKKRKEIVKTSKPESQSRILGHSQSFDAKAKKRQNNERRPRRTRSTDELFLRHRRDDLDRLKRYNQNWEDFEHSFTDPTLGDRRQSNKMRGKDVNIEITNDKGIKLTVNCSDEDTKDKLNRRSNKCAIPKSRRKSKEKTPQPYTEEIFKEVPIWFKKSSKHSTNEQPRNKRNSLKRIQETCKEPKQNVPVGNRPDDSKKHIENKRNVFMQEKQSNRRSSQGSANIVYKDSNDGDNIPNPNALKKEEKVKANETLSGQQNTAYIVEEPPDACPICLEDLPGSEARALACCHVIHTKCLIVYLHKSDLDFGIRCPLCAQTTLIRNYYVPKERWFMELPVSTAV